MSNGRWEHWALGLLGILSAALLSNLATAKNHPTRTEIVEIVRVHSPYVEDRALLQKTVERNTAAFEALRLELTGIHLTIARVDSHTHNSLGRVSR